MTSASALMALFAALFVLSGCGQSIRANITVTHTVPDSTNLTRYAFVPLKDQDESSENAGYRNATRQALTRHHYVESDVPDASLLLSFSYGISKGREVQSQGIVPVSSYSEYRRGLWVFMFRKGADGADENKLVYEGTVMCAGTLTQVATAMPQMIRALFRDFPGESGTTRKEFIEP